MKKASIVYILFFFYIAILTIQFDSYSGGQYNSIKPIQLALGLSLSLFCYFFYSKKPMNLTLKPLLIFGLSYSFYFLTYNLALQHGDIASLKKLIISLLAYASAFLFFLVLYKQKEKLLFLINLSIWLNVIFLTAQLAAYYGAGFNFDPHSTFFPFSRILDTGISWGIFRPRGLQLEPGVYAIFVFLGTLISYCLAGHLEKKHIVFIFSILLSTSVSGILSGCLFLAYAFTKENGVSRYMMLIIVVLLLLVIAQDIGLLDYLSVRYLDRDTFNPDSSDGSKLTAIKYLLDSDFSRLVFGSGYGINDSGVDFYVRSLGPLFSLFYFSGIFGLVLYAYLLNKLNFEGKALLLLASSIKVGLDVPMFWLLVCCLLYFKSKRPKVIQPEMVKSQ